MTDAIARLNNGLTDRYHLKREIGAGGMATVFLADDIRHGRQVAVKVLHAGLSSTVAAARFFQEIRILAGLQHPHILLLIDSGEVDGLLYYVMPFVEGESLRSMLARRGPLPVPEALALVSEVADALAHAHRQGIVHRDIKPDNILVSGNHLLVADFGIAKALSDAAAGDSMTVTGGILGTPSYMSPEQVSGEGSIDHRTDLYSLGVVAYEALVGELPFRGGSPQAVLMAHLAKEPDTVVARRPDVPAAVSSAVMRCLEKDPDARWRDAEEFRTELQRAIAGHVASDASPHRSSPNRWWWIAAGGAIAVMAAVAAVGVLQTADDTTGRPRVIVASLETAGEGRESDNTRTLGNQRITERLSLVGNVAVVPVATARQLSRRVAADIEQGRITDAIAALAGRAEAEYVVSWSYFTVGDSVELHAELTDVSRGITIGSVPGVRSSQASLGDAFARLGGRIAGLLAVARDDRLSAREELVARPPTFEAYQALDEGLRVLIKDPANRTAAFHFGRAFALDSSFVLPLLLGAYSLDGAGQFAARDSMLNALWPARDQLSKHHRRWFDGFVDVLQGNVATGLDELREAVKIDPQSHVALYFSRFLLSVNRSEEALEVLVAVDRDRGVTSGSLSFWDALTWAYHESGRHEDELEAALQARGLFKERLAAASLELDARAALGDVEGVGRLLKESEKLDDRGRNLGQVMFDVAEEFRAHGFDEAVQPTFDQALEWYRRSTVDSASTADRINIGYIYYSAGRFEEAKLNNVALMEENRTSPWRRLRGALIEARLGNRQEAARVADSMAGVDPPLNRGLFAETQAYLYALLGEEELALARAREAVRFGQRWARSRHRDIDVAPLLAYGPFQLWVNEVGAPSPQ